MRPAVHTWSAATGQAAESEPLFLAGAESLLVAAGLLSDDDEDDDESLELEDEPDDEDDDEPLDRLSVL